MRAAVPSLAPRPLNAEYYAQRATPGGLIIAEASPVSTTAFGNSGVPGIYTEQQMKAWRAVVDAVHAKGGFIFLKLWHVGRVSHSSFQPAGAMPVAPSAVPMSSEYKTFTAEGEPTSYEVPRALETDEVPGIVATFGQAARNAKEVGFDGVEVHGANGYLIEQFLQSRTTHGSIRRFDREPLPAFGHGFVPPALERRPYFGWRLHWRDDLRMHFFISNPDLPIRLERGLPIAPYNRATFCGRDEVGYTDYPAYEA